jgi:flagellar hook-length control protein FliK
MDMSNATAAGPSRGILEVLFGSKSAEEAEADGQGFGGLMNLIKKLKENKDSEELGAQAGRTPWETTPGKGGTDGSVVGMPGMMAEPNETFGSSLALAPADGEIKEKQEKLMRLSMLFGTPAAAAMMQAAEAPKAQPDALQAVQPEQVNQALRQKALPPLSPQEMKLLQEVNGKIEQANASPMMNPQAAQDQAPAPQLQKAMAQKGIDPKKLKSAETSGSPMSGTPEKMVSTETYLQMHEGMNKPAAKEVAGKNQNVVKGEQALPQARAPEALTAGAVAGTSQKELGSHARKGELAEQLPEGSKQTKLDAAGGAFGSALAHQTGETMRHDVYLPGAEKPEEMRRALMGEVGTGVALHAGKGGGEMRLVLHPDDMGEVKLKVGTKNGKVEVELMAGNEETAKILRSGSKELEHSLKEQNLSLAKFEVTVSDTTNVVATDVKTNLSDQFPSQNQQHGGFSQGTMNDEGRNSRWSGDQGGRQASSYGSAEDSGRSMAKSMRSVPKQAARDNSRRLDVVA